MSDKANEKLRENWGEEKRQEYLPAPRSVAVFILVLSSSYSPMENPFSGYLMSDYARLSKYRAPQI